MKTLCFIITLIAACIGAIILFVTLRQATGAPQEAAGAAIALCVTVIPYVFSRSIEKLAEPHARRVIIVHEPTVRIAETPHSALRDEVSKFENAIGRQEGESMEEYMARTLNRRKPT